ncbi:hypothetical protein ACUNV4_12170 [Granulosicoccus sp. 3-233]|uniref:hypothetical protein n=1 Tax=Granulosicoccus sp. 3-233 TaxID=3417969 RepID=UPI003D33EDA7
MAALRGNFTLTSALTDHQELEVTTSEPMTAHTTGDFLTAYPEAWSFSSGTLEMTAEDGSALQLKADSGNVDTAEISLMQDDVVLETFQQPWSLWHDTLTRVQADPRGR